eukprot:1551220-Rhodomonas_salina.1
MQRFAIITIMRPGTELSALVPRPQHAVREVHVTSGAHSVRVRSRSLTVDRHHDVSGDALAQLH